MINLIFQRGTHKNYTACWLTMLPTKLKTRNRAQKTDLFYDHGERKFVNFPEDFSRKVVEFYYVPVFLRLNLSSSINRTFKISFIIVPINLGLCFLRRRQVYESCTSGVKLGTSCRSKLGTILSLVRNRSSVFNIMVGLIKLFSGRRGRQNHFTSCCDYQFLTNNVRGK